jgi:hypothetical protein
VEKRVEVKGRELVVHEVYGGSFSVVGHPLVGKVCKYVSLDGDRGTATFVPESERALVVVVYKGNGNGYRFEFYEYNGKEWVEVDPCH